MKLTIIPHLCAEGECMPLSPVADTPGHRLCVGDLPPHVGARLYEPGRPDEPLFMVVGHSWLCDEASPATGKMQSCPILMALRPIKTSVSIDLSAKKPGYAVAAITLSDKGAQGLREDTAGPLCIDLLEQSLPITFGRVFLLPDNSHALQGLLAELAFTQKYDLVCTCGSTGLGPRDIAPQTTAKLIDLPLPGFTQAMMSSSLSITPNAAISRAVAGIAGNCLILNLPGSARAVRENLLAITAALAHALAKLNGDTSDCGVPLPGDI